MMFLVTMKSCWKPLWVILRVWIVLGLSVMFCLGQDIHGGEM